MDHWRSFIWTGVFSGLMAIMAPFAINLYQDYGTFGRGAVLITGFAFLWLTLAGIWHNKETLEFEAGYYEIEQPEEVEPQPEFTKQPTVSISKMKP